MFENLEVSFPRGRTVFGALAFQRTPTVKERVEEVAEDDLPEGPAATPRPAYLSHGQKQWLEIGMLLMQDPELLMLDEPVAGMSVSEREQDRRAAQPHLQGPLGASSSSTTWSSSSDIAHKVTVMHQGKILAEGHAWSR